MKYTMQISLLWCAMLAVPPLAHADSKPPVVKQNRNGFYRSFIYTGTVGLRYYVDSVAQICFSNIGDSTFTVPCSKLKNRPEWHDIISWEQSPVQSEPASLP